MKQPFNKEQIKNLLLLYTAIVIIMILFYFLNTLLSEQKHHEQKVFDTNISVNREVNSEKLTEDIEENSSLKSHFKLLDKGY